MFFDFHMIFVDFFLINRTTKLQVKTRQITNAFVFIYKFNYLSVLNEMLFPLL